MIEVYSESLQKARLDEEEEDEEKKDENSLDGIVFNEKNINLDNIFF
jgi:hypothetical protein